MTGAVGMYQVRPPSEPYGSAVWARWQEWPGRLLTRVG